MKKILLTLSAAAVAVATALAVPAKPGVKKLLTLKDGTRVEATLTGDEHVNYFLTEDQRAIQLVDGHYQYVNRDALISQHDEILRKRNQVRSARRRSMMQKVSYKGKRKGLVIMVEFSDVKFTFDKATYNDYFNKPGYNSFKMAGSVHDYFLAQSYGQFDLEFDIVGPVTLSQTAEYYGYDLASKTSHNDRVAAMVNNLCKTVDSQVDYSQYDWDQNGYVDQVYVIYAGYGAAQGADHTIWPHEWSVRGGVNNPYRTAEGPIIETYGISCELQGDGVRGTGRIDGIGTSCHEFSHCLGLPDFYDTRKESTKNFGMSYWDLMDAGCYLDNGCTPCGYTAFERWFSGWLEPIELNEGADIEDMPAIEDEPVAYIISNDNHPQEFYMLANHQQKGFDAKACGHGMLVIHANLDDETWATNKVNNDPDLQGMTIIAADNSYASGAANLAGDPFPGSKNKTMLTDDSTPAATLYYPNADGQMFMGKPITDIVERGELISFKFMGGGSGVEAPVMQTPVQTAARSFMASWTPIEGAVEYLLQLSRIGNSAAPDQHQLFSEDFAKFKNSVYSLQTDLASKLDTYMGTTGWTGEKLFRSPLLLRIGNNTAQGYLLSPAFQQPTEGALTIAVNAVGISNNKGELQLRVYKDGTDQYASTTLSNLPASSSPATTLHLVNLDWNYGPYRLAVYPTVPGVYMSHLALYDGEYTPEDFEQSCKSADVRWNIPDDMTPESQPRKVQYRTPENSLTLDELEPGQYACKVRAYTADGKASPWSTPVVIDLVTALQLLKADAPATGDALYDLSGRKVSTPSRGIYIRNNRKILVP